MIRMFLAKEENKQNDILYCQKCISHLYGTDTILSPTITIYSSATEDYLQNDIVYTLWKNTDSEVIHIHNNNAFLGRGRCTFENEEYLEFSEEDYNNFYNKNKE